MTTSFNKSVICPVLIGRAAHLTAVDHLLSEVHNCRGQTLLIAGEAGLGKSRLVAEVKRQAAAQNWPILQGHCFETEQALPYAPILNLLRAYCLGRPSAEIVRAFGPAAPEFVALLPELASWLPELGEAPLSRPEQEKHRFFHALAQFCARLAVSGPLLLIVEDLHWSDEACLELLLYLARYLATQPVLLLFTYRSDELRPGLTHFLAQLDRQRLATELILSPLNREEVDMMLQTIFDQPRPIRTEFLETVYTLTEGNPFFIEEILKAMLMAGEIFYAEDGLWDRKPMHELHIPRSVQDAVRQRSQQLSAGARQLLTLAAVTGRQFDFTLLQHMIQSDEAELLEQIKELIAAQLLIEESAEQFAFRHALTRQAVYATLLARERRRLHRTIGEVLETLYGETLEAHDADLAYHFYQGEMWAKSLDYSQRAGERALALYAPHAAIEHLTHAIEAAQRLSQLPSAQLFYLRGQAFAALSEFEAARADYQQALDTARSQAEHRVEWQALLALGYLWASRDYGRTGDYFQQALTQARTLADPAMIGHSLNYMGNWQMNQGRPLAALREHQEALGIFQQLADPAGLAQTLDLLGIASYNCSDLLQGRAYYRQAVPLWQQLGDRQGLVHSLCGLGLGVDFELEFDDVLVAEGVAWCEKGVQVAREINWRSGEAFALICLGLALRQHGQYSRAFKALHQALAIATDIEHRSWTADTRHALGALYRDMLALPAAQQQLEEALALGYAMNSPIWIYQAAGTLASVYILQHDLTRAQSVLDQVMPASAPPQTLQQRFIWGARAELALAQGDAASALEIVDRLLASTLNLDPPSNLPHQEGEGKVVPRLWHLRGAALAALHRFAEAEAALSAAREVARRQARPGRQWRLHLALGQAYQAQGKNELAGAEFAAARALIEALATTLSPESLPEAGSLQENFMDQALALLPSAPSVLPQAQAHQECGGLTPREREVAALVAQGKTNREIAETLIISERTAERHVANIMAKLNFKTRAQIAAWASKKW